MAVIVGNDSVINLKQDSKKQQVSAFVSEINTEEPSTPSRSSLLPYGAYDTHVHVFDPRLGPYATNRSYTPNRAPFEDLKAFSKSLSGSSPPTCANFVLVQPSPYRTDNSVLLHLLRQCRDDGSFVMAIAVVDVNTVTDAELNEMHDLGVRGLRLNLQADGKDVDIRAFETILERAAKRISWLQGWILQVYAPGLVWTELHDTIMKSPVPIIADHVGGLLSASKLPSPLNEAPTSQPGFEALISLAKASRVFVKISGLYRASDDQLNNFADMEPIVRKLAAEAPHSLIWGSDWPHTGEGKDRARNKNIEVREPFRVIDNLAILKHLREWVGSEEAWKKMMVENPQKLFQ